ncbi:MAG: alpha/beta fold hydrolase [candidate division NC10 bacterium]
MAGQRRLQVVSLVVFVLVLATLPPSWAAERVTVKASDGTVLVGDLYLPTSQVHQKAPLVVLLHMLSRNRGDWQPYIPRLTTNGNAALTMDLRGHGESIQTGHERLNWRNFRKSDYAKMPADLLATLDALFRYGDRIDLDRVAVIGASIGCNVALVAAAERQAIRALVLLSPGLDYRGIKTKEAIGRYGGRPILLVAAAADTYSAKSTRTLYGVAAGPKEIKIYSGGAHGTRILEHKPDAVTLVLGWLNRFFPHQP